MTPQSMPDNVRISRDGWKTSEHVSVEDAFEFMQSAGVSPDEFMSKFNVLNPNGKWQTVGSYGGYTRCGQPRDMRIYEKA